jgi:hypothetical protein
VDEREWAATVVRTLEALTTEVRASKDSVTQSLNALAVKVGQIEERCQKIDKIEKELYGAPQEPGLKAQLQSLVDQHCEENKRRRDWRVAIIGGVLAICTSVVLNVITCIALVLRN